MSAGYPRTPLEALNRVAAEINSLRFPAKLGTVLDCADEMARLLEHHVQHFPLNRLREEIAAVQDQLSNEYDDPDCEIDRKASVYEQIVGLRHRVVFSMEFLAASKVLESVERRLERIDSVLPAQNYAVRRLLAQLPVDRIGVPTRRRLEAAVNHFEGQDYKTALREATEAGESLFVLYRQCHKSLGCGQIPRDQGPALGHIRKWMSDSGNTDGGGMCFAASSRIEWFLLSMFEALLYLRNAVSHPSEAEGERLPAWQCRRRADFPETPECARLALCLSFQIVLELQALMDQAGT